MENQSLRIGIIALSIILTAILVGGGVFFLQQNSIEKLQEEITDLQKVTAEESITDEQVKIPKTNEIKPDVKEPEIQENITSLAAGVEWLSYNDDDLSFVYPKTFLETSFQDPSDENLARTKWEVSRQGNIIYIQPNFESPIAEFGSTYEIQIIDNHKDADFLHTSTENGTTPKNLCIPLKNIQIQGYTVCAFEKEVNEGLGRVGKYYAVMPVVKNGSQTAPWIYIFDASGGMYSDYISSTLLSSLKIK